MYGGQLYKYYLYVKHWKDFQFSLGDCLVEKFSAMSTGYDCGITLRRINDIWK